jgi:outer membrane protein OmpA-like peptidoglycan-associated protein
MERVTINKEHARRGSFFVLLSLICLAISLLIHFLFFQKAKKWEVFGFSPESYDTIVPRTFKMKRVEIDPKTLENEPLPPKQERQKPIPIPIEKEIPQSDHPIVSSEQNILSKPQESISLEKPGDQMPVQGVENLLSKPETTTTQTSKGELPKSIDNELSLGAETAIQLPEPHDRALMGSLDPSASNQGNKNELPQFSSLDALLAESGTVKKNTAPILMPTDLLFEYDSDALKPAATATLTKLGSLINRNAKATFRIEGHTDSFGSDDYNKALSLRRAEAVKNWLFTNMGIDASRISTVGLGKGRLLVPATGNVEQQQLNRRVEIVISAAKGSAE